MKLPIRLKKFSDEKSLKKSGDETSGKVFRFEAGKEIEGVKFNFSLTLDDRAFVRYGEDLTTKLGNGLTLEIYSNQAQLTDFDETEE